MSHDVPDDVGVAHDVEIEPPVPVDASLPAVFRFVVLLGVKRRVVEVAGKKLDLFKNALRTRQERLPGLSALGEGSRFSSRAFGFPGGGSLLQLTFHMRDHAPGGAKGAKGTAFFQVFLRFVETGIDDAPFGRGVFGVSARELGTVNHQLGGDDNPASLEGKVHKIALGQAGLAADAGRNGYLTFVLDLCGGVHKDIRGSIPEVQNPDFCL